MKRSLALRSLVLAGAMALFGAEANAFLFERNPVTDIVNGRNPLSTSPVRREIVPYTGKHAAGTIVVSTAERRLYLVLPQGKAIRYGIGVGRDGFQWGGVKTVSAKKEWPDWTPPPQMLKRRPELPRFMPGGPSNPLGARAMYLGSSLFRIHGSNEPQTIGQAVSSGCFRMTNDDVVDLYDRVKVGTRVVVLR
jgi:lipoprotein-anchoring transpeptidase ErfK/SrfK